MQTQIQTEIAHPCCGCSNQCQLPMSKREASMGRVDESSELDRESNSPKLCYFSARCQCRCRAWSCSQCSSAGAATTHILIARSYSVSRIRSWLRGESEHQDLHSSKGPRIPDIRRGSYPCLR